MATQNFDFITEHTDEFDGGIYAEVRDADGDRNNVLDSTVLNHVFVRWFTTGTLTPVITGDWNVDVILDPVLPAGAQIPLVVPGLPIPLLPHPPAYSVLVDIPAGTATPAGLYKCLILVTHIVGGVATRMAGFYEIPTVRFK